MAAVRRGSESGVVIALVIFVVLAIVGIGFAVWSYSQLRMAQNEIEQNQQLFANNVGAAFNEAGWQLSTQTPTELGFKYGQQSYEDVAQKLEQAAECEKELMPTLGWQSLEGLRTDLSDSPAQAAAEAAGLSPYGDLRGLLQYYEETYADLKQQVASLNSENAALENQVSSLKQSLTETEREWGDKLAEATEDFQNKIAQLRQDYEDIVGKYNEQRQQTADWRQKHGQEVAEHERDVNELQRRLTHLQERYDEVVRGPQPEEKMAAESKVLVMNAEDQFVVLEGGADEDRKPETTYVIYRLTPDGQQRKKGTVEVAEVYEHSSLAVVTDETETILVGDPAVTKARWDRFHGQLAQAGGGS